MKGTYKIKISNSKVTFNLELERNITIICGKSATGKTTLIGLIRDYEQLGKASGVTIQCKMPYRCFIQAAVVIISGVRGSESSRCETDLIFSSG